MARRRSATRGAAIRTSATLILGALALCYLGARAVREPEPIVVESAPRAVAQTKGVSELPNHLDSVPILLEAMADLDPFVRARAGAKLRTILGVDYAFDANAPFADRRRAIAAYRNWYEQYRQAAAADQ
jgi:hypothetical protein